MPNVYQVDYERESPDRKSPQWEKLNFILRQIYAELESIKRNIESVETRLDALEE
jgi:hypothetical protein